MKSHQKSVTHHCKLNKCSKDEGSTGSHPNIYCLKQINGQMEKSINGIDR